MQNSSGNGVAPKQGKIVFCIPSRGFNSHDFTMCFASAYAKAVLDYITAKVAVVGQNWVEGTYIDNARNELAVRSLEQGATHLMFLDDDMQFPQNIVDRLMRADKPMVGVNYPTRKPPPEPVATMLDDDTQRYWPEAGATGLTKVNAIGFGAVLLRAEIFEKIEYPFFNKHWDAENECSVGEDVDFCRKVRAAGYNVWVDDGLSEDIQHAGVDLDYARKWRDAAGGVIESSMVEVVPR